MSDFPICDVCGERAIYIEKDLKEIDSNRQPCRTEWTTVFAAGPIRFGCDKHPPKPHRVLYLSEDRNWRLSDEDRLDIKNQMFVDWAGNPVP